MSDYTRDDYNDVRNVVGRYFQLADDEDWQAWAALLTEDFRIDVNGRVTEGRAKALQEHIDLHAPDLPKGRHLSGNVVVEMHGDDTATATFDWVWVAALGVPSSMVLSVLEMGRCVDQLRRENEAWLIGSRDNRPTFFKP